jgi:plastocyanin
MKLQSLVSTFVITFAAGSVSFAAANHTVVIEGMKFIPDQLTIKKGDTVVWINKDIFAHTVTETKQRFNSNVVNASASWKHAFNEAAGKYEYVCTLHPTMKGVLNIK